MKLLIIFSAVVAVSFGSYVDEVRQRHIFDHRHPHVLNYIPADTYSHQKDHSPPFVQRVVHHAASITHGGDYAVKGDLLGSHSFSYDGVSPGHNLPHEGFLPTYSGGHNIEFPLSYDLRQRSKLYGGYVGGFGGYAKGALESIQHLNQENYKLQPPLLGYESPKSTGPVSFGHAGNAHLTHPFLEHHYGGQHGISGIGGAHYGLEYKKAKA